MQTALSYISTIAGMVQSLYFIGVLVFFLLILTQKQRKERNLELLRSVNIVMLMCATITSLHFLSDLFIAWYTPLSYEQAAFKLKIASPYWYAYWAITTGQIILPQLLWWPKLRKSISYSVVLCVFSLLVFCSEWIMIYITSGYRDYRPGGWVYYPPKPLELIIPPLVYISTVAVVHFIRMKLKARKTDTARP